MIKKDIIEFLEKAFKGYCIGQNWENVCMTFETRFSAGQLQVKNVIIELYEYEIKIEE